MSKNKAIYTVFSDLHLTENYRFHEKGDDTWLENGLDVFNIISNQCLKYNTKCLFLGDLFHHWKELSNKVMMRSLEQFKVTFENNQIPFIAISGNHDQSQANTIDNPSPTYLRGFDSSFGYFHLIDGHFYKDKDNKVIIFGIPYLSSNKGLDQYLSKALKYSNKFKDYKTILLLHTDLPGARTAQGFVFGEENVHNISPNFKEQFPFNLVLSGHIHNAQKLDDNVYIIGAPQHQAFRDVGAKAGFWTIYQDLSIKFTSLLGSYPNFYSPTTKEEASKLEAEGHYVRYPEEEPEYELEEGDIEESHFSKDNTSSELAENYLASQGEVNERRSELLASILNRARNA